jgi:hypothetical protein
MSTRRTRTYTRRSDAMDSGDVRRARVKALKALKRPLDAEEIAELRKLIQEMGNG